MPKALPQFGCTEVQGRAPDRALPGIYDADLVLPDRVVGQLVSWQGAALAG